MKISKYLSLFILFLVLGCNPEQIEKQSDQENIANNNWVLKLTEEQKIRADIQIGKAEQRSISNEIAFIGFIEVPPENLHSIHSPIKGFVQSVPVIEGDKVRKGQVLTSISHPDIIVLQQNYIKEWSKLSLLESELKRQKELLIGQATAAKKLELAQSEFTVQKALVAGLKSQLRLLNLSVESVENGEIKEVVNIISPASGTISMLNINAGKLMNSDELILEIIDRSHLHIELQVFEKDISNVSIGQPFDFLIPGNNELFGGEVYLIGQKVDAVRKTVVVHGHPIIENDKFIAGMQIRGNIKSSQREVLSLPSTAVIMDGEEAYVFIVRNDGFHREKIDVLGVDNGQYYELIKPIQEKIVINGVWFLESLFQQE